MQLAKGWYSELGELWKGQAMSLEIEETVFSEHSGLQKVEVFKRLALHRPITGL